MGQFLCFGLCVTMFAVAGCAPRADAKHPLAKRLLDPFTSDQVSAMDALHRMPVEERGVLLDDLIRGATHKDPYIRTNAVVALAELGQTWAEKTTPVLRGRLSDENEHVRIYAGMALVRLGDPAGEPTVKLVTERLERPPHEFARATLAGPLSWAARGENALDLSSTISPLAKIAQSGRTLDVTQALAALVSLRAVEALPTIDALAASSADSLVRSHAANAARVLRNEASKRQ